MIPTRSLHPRAHRLCSAAAQLDVEQGTTGPEQLQVRVSGKLLFNIVDADGSVRIVGEQFITDPLDFAAHLVMGTNKMI